ncbi:MAG TPA: rod shape-determining protein MreC, partial [Thermodesulfobacteriota bacterium]|nr:rod shape-determining protein MreC [Thermodesulfobacteriota bacterium]
LQVSFPLQQGAQKIFLWFKEIGEDYIFLSRVREENRDLRKVVGSLREENNRLREALLTDERLKKLEAWQVQSSRPAQVARVYARGPSTWFKTVLVNKGEKDGVKKEMAVVTSEGVVGRVIESSGDTAKVLLVSDANSAVDVLVQGSRAQGILEGKIDDVCIIKYVQKNEEIQVGDRVITSGLGGVFPKGLMVGTVTAVDRKRPGIFQHVEVAPAVDLSKIEEVLILTDASR